MLRKHQRELVELTKKIAEEYKLNGKLPDKPEFVADIVAEVFPGGGKSTHPIFVFKILKEAGIVDKLCWVVPRTSLKKQGAQEFLKPYLKDLFPHELEIRETETINDVNPTRDTDGYITTYQSLVSAKSNNKNRDNCHKYEFSQHRYLLFLDECQHIVEDKNDKEGYGYYQAVKPLFELAAFKVGSSGTLFRRHENEKVAFVNYELTVDENGEEVYEPKIDLSYTYDDAINEKAIIPIYFNKGQATSVKYTKKGKNYDKAKLENNTDLSVALDTEYGEELLREGLQIWEDYKTRTNPRSKLIIIGYNQNHCRKIQSTLSRKGLSCALAISDEGKSAQDSITKFRTSPKSNILVTCQMAYEGLDCKQATHLIVLTKIRSLPWLIQMFTRVMRYDTDNKELSWENQEAYATIPNDPAMKDALKFIKAKPKCAISEKDELEELLKNLESLGNEWEPSIIENKSSKMGGVSQCNLDGDELSHDVRAKIKLHQQKYRLNQAEIDTYKMLRDTGTLSVLDQYMSSNDSIMPESNGMTIREKEDQKRNDIEQLARKLDYKFNVNFGTWNKKAHNAFRFKKRKDMTYEELTRVMNWMKVEAIEEAKKKLT